MPKLIVFVLCLFAAAAAADDDAPAYDVVQFSVSASAEIDNDVLVVRLAAQHEGASPAVVADAVNEDIAWALQRAKGVTEVSQQTEQYNTYPVYRQQRITGWRARQALKLESENAEALTELTGVLQERLAVESMAYQVSPDRRAEAEAELTDDAIEAFLERGRRIANAFGRADFRLVEIYVDTGQARTPRPMMLSRAMVAESADIAAPNIEGGTQAVTVSVRGSIELSR